MKSIYIIADDKKIGPLSVSDLLNYEINEETLVWYEGKEDWQPASEILELKGFLVSKSFLNSIDAVPPTIDYLVDGNLTQPEAFLKVNKKLFISYVLVVVVILITTTFFFFYSYRVNKQKLLEKDKLLIEKSNVIVHLEDSIAKLKSLNANYEFMEYEKAIEEELSRKQHQIMQLSSAILEAIENQKKAEKLLKTAIANRDYGDVNDRIKDINFAKEEVEIWKKKVIALENELKQLETF